MTREKLKPMIEDFISDKDHQERELMIAVRMNGYTIADFQINEDGRDITESSLQAELTISNIYSDTMGLAPDMVHIKYEDVKTCEIGTHKGECETDVIADIMTFTYENGTEIEIGFLCI